MSPEYETYSSAFSDSANARQLIISETGLLDGVPDEVLDEIAILASELCRTPIACIAVQSQGSMWLKSRVGIQLDHFPYQSSFSAATLRSDRLFIVPDAQQDPSFIDHPLVRGGMGVRFFAGAPIRTREGFPVAILAVLDREPRPPQQAVVRGLETLAKQASRHLELCREIRHRSKLPPASVTPQADSVHSYADETGKLVWVQGSWEEFTGSSPATASPETWRERIHPEDYNGPYRELIHAVQNRQACRCEYRMRDRHGRWRWILATAVPCIRDDGSFAGMTGTAIDITDRWRSEQSLRDTLRAQTVLASRERLLMRELNHRVRNNLAGLLGLLSYYASTQRSGADLAASLRRKVHAMSIVHDMISWSPGEVRETVSLEKLFASLADAMTPIKHRDSVIVDGPPVMLRATHASALAMILQELLTNSVKYGALMHDGGKALVSWGLDDGDLRLTWKEQLPSSQRLERCEQLNQSAQKPMPDFQAGRGAGLPLIQGLAASELQGRVEFQFEPEGLTCVLRARIEQHRAPSIDNLQGASA